MLILINAFKKLSNLGYGPLAPVGRHFIAPVPSPQSYAGFAEELRRTAIGRVAQMAAGGYLTYDPNPETELGTGEDPNAYQSWASDDQCHPNAAGHDWIATRLRDTVQASLAL